MPYKFRITLVVALGVFVGAASLIQAANHTAGQPSSATIVSPQDAVTTYHVRDMDGNFVTVHVPSMASPGLKVSNPAAGTVRATVRAIDGEKNQVKVQTQEGQMLVLSLPPEAIMNMQVGNEFMLQGTQRSAP